MKLSDYIVDFLDKEGVDKVFGYMGGMITHLVDSISQSKNIQFIQTYHEQTAAIAAEGYAIESGKFGVAISTSGPGATNMMTGIADAYFDSIPVIYITGQVNTYEYKYDKTIRQQGFQETDVVSIVKPITKYAKFIDDPNQIRYELEKAIHIARSGRPGPVLLDIPMDIQRANIDISHLSGYEITEDKKTLKYCINDILELISNAECPMILVGAGCQSKDASLVLDEFIKRTSIPVVSSLMGKGVIDETLPNFIGMIGSYGNRCANISIANADVLIVLGSRLDTRQTGAMVDQFLQKSIIIHVDIDNNELIHHRLNNRVQVLSDVISFLDQIKSVKLKNSLKEWNNYLRDLKTKYNQEKEIERFVENKAPYLFIQMLNKYSGENDVFCADIGQNQMWAAQTLNLKKNQKFITSGGLAPMGFSLPVAIGISFADRNKTIYSINGDGGFHMSLQSLMLISQYNLPIKVIVLNNKALGMITQFQQLYFDGRMTGTTNNGGYLVPDIENISASYNLQYFQIAEEDLMNDDLMRKVIGTRNCIIEFVIEGITSVCPKLEYNKPIQNPIPLLSEEELNGAMFKHV